MKYGDVLPQPSFPWWLCVVVAFAEASETMMDFLKRRYLKRESYFRLRDLEQLHNFGEALGCEKYLKQILDNAIST